MYQKLNWNLIFINVCRRSLCLVTNLVWVDHSPDICYFLNIDRWKIRWISYRNRWGNIFRQNKVKNWMLSSRPFPLTFWSIYLSQFHPIFQSSPRQLICSMPTMGGTSESPQVRFKQTNGQSFRTIYGSSSLLRLNVGEKRS